MKPPPFAYHAPESLDEAVATLTEQGDDAKVLAGGQSLIPLLSLRLARPTALIDLNGVSELSSIEVNGQTAIGAMTRHRTIERSPRSHGGCPSSPRRCRTSGTPRSGTEARSAAASPTPIPPRSSRGRARARRHVRGPQQSRHPDDRRRRLLLRLLHDGARGRRDPDPDDFPNVAPRTGVSVQEMARRHGDFAMVAAVASVTLDGDVRIALINVADRPVRATEAEAAMQTGVAIDEVVALATRGLDPSADLHATAAYRRQVAGVLVRRALTEASERARGTT